MALISNKLRNSARGQRCTLQIAGICCDDPERTVLCHIRDESKGMGNKAADWSACFGCDRCHEAIDQHRLPVAEERFYLLRALQRTWAIWIAKGLILLPVDPATAKKRPKKKSYLPSRPIQSRNNLRRKPKEDTSHD